MNYRDKIKLHLQASAQLKQQVFESCCGDIIKAVESICSCFRAQGKLLICGNGGSAADAQHLATEFVVRLSHEINRPGLPALALTTDSSLLTAAGNDLGFGHIFSRQVEAFGQAKDVLLAISTSGNSENILQALASARQKKLGTIGLLGSGGGKMKGACEVAILIPSHNVQHIQECHITVGHIICELVEKTLFS